MNLFFPQYTLSIFYSNAVLCILMFYRLCNIIIFTLYSKEHMYIYLKNDYITVENDVLLRVQILYVSWSGIQNGHIFIKFDALRLNNRLLFYCEAPRWYPYILFPLFVPGGCFRQSLRKHEKRYFQKLLLKDNLMSINFVFRFGLPSGFSS